MATYENPEYIRQLEQDVQVAQRRVEDILSVGVNAGMFSVDDIEQAYQEGTIDTEAYQSLKSQSFT